MGKKYTLASGANLYAQNGSTEFQIAGSTGLLYSQGRPVLMPDSTVAYDHYVEMVSLTSGGASPSTITPYGFTYVVPNTTGGDFSTSARTIVLGNPIIGVRKSIRFGSTAASANTLWVDLTTNCGVMDSTGGSTNRYITFSTLATQPQCLNLIGVTTAIWAVTSVDSTVGGFEATAASIRAETAVESSG